MTTASPDVCGGREACATVPAARNPRSAGPQTAAVPGSWRRWLCVFLLLLAVSLAGCRCVFNAERNRCRAECIRNDVAGICDDVDWLLGLDCAGTNSGGSCASR